MSGGIVQLVATGVQDAHLTGNPEISFFRSQFKRHTHFAMSNELQLLQGVPGPGNISTIRFERKGDLLSYVYFTARDGGAVLRGLDWGSIIDRVELLIGGQVIDTQDVFFSNTISPMFISSNFSTRYQPGNPTPVFFPLQFWFCKDWQSALPLIALQFHDVEIRITWSSNTTNWAATPTGSSSTYQQMEYRVWSNFVYLDKQEREFFANNPMDLIMWQMQRQVLPTTGPIMETAFNHPMKFLAFPSTIYSSANQTLRMQINGVDVGIDKTLINYSQVYPYYHTQYGFDAQNSSYASSPVALIPFCLDTTKLQPTGTLNFSRLDTFRLITSPQNTIRGATTASSTSIMDASRSQYLYGVNYNVLRIKSGMAGLLYSN
jgi:hypothetical protein